MRSRVLENRFSSGKTWPYSEGLTVTFRQHKASHSHCHKLHGYAIQVETEFYSSSLDELNWVVDFGGLAPFKTWLKENFDHTTVIAEDDPELETFRMLDRKGIIDLRVFPAVGMEAFSQIFFYKLKNMLQAGEFQRNPAMGVRKTPVFLKHVIVREHDSNFGKFEEYREYL